MRKLLIALALAGTSTPALAKIELVVDRSDKLIRVYQNGTVVDTQPVAMGKEGMATPTGSWTIRQVDINPDWYSTRGLGYYKPGPDVPLGRVRLRYNGVYALHGTNNPDSIGTYATLGCIRMQNPAVLDLARLILQDTGTWLGDDWWDMMVSNQYKQHQIRLKEPVSIKVVE